MIPRATVRDLSYLGLTVAVEGGIPAGLAALVAAGIRQAA